MPVQVYTTTPALRRCSAACTATHMRLRPLLRLWLWWLEKQGLHIMHRPPLGFCASRLPAGGRSWAGVWNIVIICRYFVPAHVSASMSAHM